MSGDKRRIFWLVAVIALVVIGAIVIWAVNRDTEGVINSWEDVDAVVFEESTD